MDSDRNLLFGVLALQADVISETQFVEACSLWATRKETPLASVLVDRGWITAEDRADVDRLVERKIRKHGGDVQASLLSATVNDVRSSIASIADADVRNSLSMMAVGTAPAVRTTDFQPQQRERYTLSRLHAKGGIGQVWLARDGDIGRDVALKELRPERAGHPIVNARFFEEAQITGQLEHPGIVPVYEMARNPEDRPAYYTMRFIRGRTLAEAIAAHHEQRRTGDLRSIEFRELINAVLAVSNSVAYAHSRGVIHRDLKPRNVILGDFGEVILLDWGLAKVRGEQETGHPGAESTDLPVRVAKEDSRDETMAGQVLGTPAYMAPEQADGRLYQQDARTDVYGLGAILYEVLTGDAPFNGQSTNDVLELVRHRQPRPPREKVAQTPLDLQAVCLKALAKNPDDRYPTATSFAHDLRHWLADEPVSARREPLTARMGRWARRNKPLVAGAAALLLTLSVFMSVLFLVSDRARRRSENEQRQTALARDEADENFQKALDAVEQLLTRVGSERLNGIPLMTNLRRQLLEDAQRFYDKTFESQSDSPVLRLRKATSKRHLAEINSMLGRPNVANRHLAEALQLLDGLDRDGHGGVAVNIERLSLLRMLGIGAYTHSRYAESERRFRECLDVYQSLPPEVRNERRNRWQHGRILLELAMILSEMGRPADAAAFDAQAETVFGQMTAEDKDDLEILFQLAALHHNRAGRLARTRKFAEAEAMYLQTIKEQESLMAKAPEYPSIRSDRGNTFMRMGDLYNQMSRPADAEKSLLTSINLYTRLVAEFPTIPAYAIQRAAGIHNLGEIFVTTGRLNLAEKAFRDSIIQLESLLTRFPLQTPALKDRANSALRLGQVLILQQRHVEAEESFANAQRQFAHLVEEHDDVPMYRVMLSAAHHSRAEALSALQRFEEAIHEFQQAQSVLRDAPAIVREEPHQLMDQGNTAMRLALTLNSLRRYDEAERAMRQAVAIYEQLADKMPNDARVQNQKAATYHNLGNLLTEADRRADAVLEYQKAIERTRVLITRFPSFPTNKSDLANSLITLATVLRDLGRHDQIESLAGESEKIYRELITTHPEFARGQTGLRVARTKRLLWAGKYTDALAVAEELVALKPQLGGHPYNAACLFALIGAAAEKPAPGKPADEAAAKQSFARALEVLQSLHRAGTLHPESFRSDSDLKPLANRPEFQPLIKEMKKPRPPKS